MRPGTTGRLVSDHVTDHVASKSLSQSAVVLRLEIAEPLRMDERMQRMQPSLHKHTLESRLANLRRNAVRDC